MQHEWRCQQNTIGRLEIQTMKLQSQLKQQSQFCTKTGYILGYCLWKASQIPDVINIILIKVNGLKNNKAKIYSSSTVNE